MSKESNTLPTILDEEALDKYIRENIKDKSVAKQDGKTLIGQLMKQTLEKMLEIEMEQHVGYSKHDVQGNGSGNSRNGKSKKIVKSDFGEFDLETPRDRRGTFEPEIVEKRQTDITGFGDKVVSLYGRGMTTREISAHIKEMYDIELSPTFVSRATEGILDDVKEWRNRPLESIYPIVFMDGLRIKIKEDKKKPVKNKVAYIALGVDLEGQQEVLGLWVDESESAHFWMSVLNDLKNRGVEDILIACVDGLTGFPSAIEAVFPDTNVQLCIVHQIRNSTKFVPWKDRKAFCADLREVYGAPTLEAAEQALEYLTETWGSKYGAAVSNWKRDWDKLTTFFGFPPELRKVIYTTNSIEGLNRGLRKNTKNRSVFPNEESALKLLYLNIVNLSRKWNKRRGWDLAISQLHIMFGD